MAAFVVTWMPYAQEIGADALDWVGKVNNEAKLWLASIIMQYFPNSPPPLKVIYISNKATNDYFVSNLGSNLSLIFGLPKRNCLWKWSAMSHNVNVSYDFLPDEIVTQILIHLPIHRLQNIEIHNPKPHLHFHPSPPLHQIQQQPQLLKTLLTIEHRTLRLV